MKPEASDEGLPRATGTAAHLFNQQMVPSTSTTAFSSGSQTQRGLPVAFMSPHRRLLRRRPHTKPRASTKKESRGHLCSVFVIVSYFPRRTRSVPSHSAGLWGTWGSGD